jgi:hypothetical protein
LARAFERHRYDVAFMCEHDRDFSEERWNAYRGACDEASTTGALLVPGIEYADPEDRVHVSVWGCTFLGAGLPTGELLRRVKEHGGFAVLAHPARRDAWEIVDPAWFPDLGGIEVWSRKWDGWAPSRRSTGAADTWGLARVVALDLHRLDQFFPLAMRLPMASPATPETAIDALRNTRARPELLTLPVGPFTRRPIGPCLDQVERLRRPVVRAVRPLINARRARRTPK